MTATQTANLAEALIKFHETVPTIHENARSFHGKFANMAGVLSTIGPALRDCGLAVSQVPAQVAGKPGLRTTLLHVSGEQITDTTPLSIQEGVDKKGNPLNVTQEWGKACTYHRRYALQAILGICVGIEDNDADSGEAVSQAPSKAPVSVPASHTPAQTQKTPEPDPLAPAVAECIEVVQEWSKQAQTNERTDLIDALMAKVAEMNGGKPAKFKQVLDSIQKIEDLSKWVALNPPLALEAAK